MEEVAQRETAHATTLQGLEVTHATELHNLEAERGGESETSESARLLELEVRQAAELLKLLKKAPKRPKIFLGGKKLLKKFRCPCIKRRGASECDDTITTFVTINLPLWHRARAGYNQPSMGECTCHVCSDSQLRERYRGMSSSLWALQEALLPCGRKHFPAYDLPGQQPFKAYRGCCISGACPRKPAVERQREKANSVFAGWAAPQERILACGWENVFGSDCPRESSDAIFKWQVWAPQLRGTNEEGKQFYSPELIPKRGTRAEFIAEFRVGVEAMLPHLWRDKMLRRGLKVHEASKDADTATLWSDYAAQFETSRGHTATCATKERHNNCVTVAGHSPYTEHVEQLARGKRPAKTFDVRKQQVDVFYGMFKSGYKPDARTYNVQREDITSILKYGRSIHGEWFCDGVRLPGGKYRGELGEGLRDVDSFDPPCPGLCHEVDVTDGCACQFAGRNNYHQTAEWKVSPSHATCCLLLPVVTMVLDHASLIRLPFPLKVKTGVDRNHLRLETMMGKGPCDGYGNVPPSTVRSAIADGKLIEPGTRELVLFNAVNKRAPSTAKTLKHGWWAAGRIFYGFYDTRLFTKEAVPEADGFDGSAKIHQVVGLSEAAETARREGPIWVRGIWCGCARCSQRDFRQCLMKDEFGVPELRYVHRKVEAIPRQPRGVLLREFAASLRADQVVAVQAAHADLNMEGGYWLALLRGDAYEALTDDLHSTDRIQAGWWVVKAQWYRLEQVSHRGYRLLASEFPLVVKHIIRIPVAFDARRHSTRASLTFLNEEKHNAILSSLAQIREWDSA